MRFLDIDSVSMSYIATNNDCKAMDNFLLPVSAMNFLFVI